MVENNFALGFEAEAARLAKSASTNLSEALL